ncbi:MAG: tRNA pseudouridine(38-40) synthase TruA [Bacteroidia bacterium]
MRRVLFIAYEGSAFSGWQKQPHVLTVQGILEKTLSKILQEPITLYGAGRTDAGVHARMQVAHLDSNRWLDKILYRLNALLPKTITVYEETTVEPTFHARHSALFRHYRYHILCQRNPFLRPYGWEVHHPLDQELLERAAQTLLGKQNFVSFCKNPAQYETTVCEILIARWQPRAFGWQFDIRANRFLQGMVRSLVGAMVRLAQNRMSWSTWHKYLQGQETNSTYAPPQGLFLEEVGYPNGLLTMPPKVPLLPFGEK